MGSDNKIFTPLELKFLKEICRGKTNKQIAVSTGYSHRTVETYKTELYRKAKVKTPIGLFLFAYKKKLITLK